MNGVCCGRLGVLTLAILLAVTVGNGWAADDASVRGTVADPLGARVSDAAVKLLLDGKVVKDVASDAEGNFTFEALASGRYQIEVSAAGFQTRTTDPMFVGGGARVSVEVAAADRPARGERVGHLGGDRRPALADRRAGHGARCENPRHAGQDRRARSAASRARLVARRDWRQGRHDLDVHPRRQLQLQQGADRRHSGERHRRRHRSGAVLDGRRRSHRSASRQPTASSPAPMRWPA